MAGKKNKKQKKSGPESKVEYTGPVHNGPLTYEMFKKVSARLRCAAEDIPNWKKFIPLTPEQAAGILLNDLPADMKVLVKIDDKGAGSLEFTSRAFDNADADFDLKKKIRSSGQVQVHDHKTGNRIGMHYMRNQMEFFKACGARRFDIYAARNVGGYAWAKMGLKPDSVRSAEFNNHVRSTVRERYNWIKHILSDIERREVEKLIKISTPADMWKLANCGLDVNKPLHDIFNKASRAAPKENQIDLSGEFNKLYDLDHRRHIEQEVANGRRVTVGKMLLLGTSWQGRIRLDDPTQMKRIGSYVGWQNIQIK